MKTDNREIMSALEAYGLSSNESAIYIFLLKKVEASVFEIAKGTGIPRTTVYSILELLQKQGFISESRKNNVAYFTSESPNKLISLIRKKEEIINEIMPQIKALTNKSIDHPVSKLFVGLDGIKNGLQDILDVLEIQKIKRIYSTSQPDLLKFLPRYFPDWLKKREDLGVYTQLILPFNSKEYLKSNEQREVRFLPEKFPFNSSVTIYGSKVAFFSLIERDPYCVIIESSSISDMFKQFFLFTWEMLG